MALDAGGWTIIPSAGGRTIFVSSSSGNNANDGLSEGSPKATVLAGLALMRSDQPDWLYLKRGDTFDISATARIDTNGGPNANAMSVITAYGTGPRPVLLYNKLWHGASTNGLKNFAITDLDFYNPRNDPSSGEFIGLQDTIGLQIAEGAVAAGVAGNILWEGNRIRYHSSGSHSLGTEPTYRISGVTIRRNVFDENIEFGLLMDFCTDVLIEENCFSYNGWHARTVRTQGLYCTGCTNITYRKNLFHRNGNMSIKLSSNYKEGCSDVLEEDNVFSRGMRGYGHADYYPERWDPATEYSHIRGVTQRNVMLHTEKDIPPGGSYQSVGLNIGNMKDWRFEKNCFIHNDENIAGGAIFAFANHLSDPFPRSENITAIDNVVHNWQSTLYNQTGSYIENIGHAINFTQQNNLTIRDPSYYPDATRDLGKYNAYLGGNDDEDDMVDIARAMDRSNWDPNYSGGSIANWILRGFLPLTQYLVLQAGGLYLPLQYTETE